MRRTPTRTRYDHAITRSRAAVGVAWMSWDPSWDLTRSLTRRALSAEIWDVARRGKAFSQGAKVKEGGLITYDMGAGHVQLEGACTVTTVLYCMSRWGWVKAAPHKYHQQMSSCGVYYPSNNPYATAVRTIQQWRLVVALCPWFGFFTRKLREYT